MRYFKSINALDELKTQYRQLALQHHPDVGGDNTVMQEINAEFDIVFHVLERRTKQTSGDTAYESAHEFKSKFYTQHGWAGSRYNSRHSSKDIAALVRDYVKAVHPRWKFSVVKDGHSSIYVHLLEAPIEIFTDDGLARYARNQLWRNPYPGTATESEIVEKIKDELANYHIQNWPWYYDYMTNEARQVLSDVQDFVNSYRYDDSDAMYDYFDTNFYPSFYIGKYKRPFKVVPRKSNLRNKSELSFNVA